MDLDNLFKIIGMKEVQIITLQEQVRQLQVQNQLLLSNQVKAAAPTISVSAPSTKW